MLIVSIMARRSYFPLIQLVLAHLSCAIVITVPTEGTTYSLNPTRSTIDWQQQMWVLPYAQ